MNKKDLTGIIYVSIAVVIWGTIGSLIDYLFLSKNIYTAGSIGQFTNFTLTGLITTIISIYFFKTLTKDKIN